MARSGWCRDNQPFVMCDLRAGTLGGQAGTRVPFSDSQLSLTFPIEQFWGRAARASWVRENPDARLILGCGADTPFDSLRVGSDREKSNGKSKTKTKSKRKTKGSGRGHPLYTGELNLWKS